MAGNTIPKWSSQSCLGLNHGHSPNHANNVNLVINLNSGLILPQLDCKFDDFSETIHYLDCDITTSANWKQLAGFVRYDATPTIQDQISNTEHLVIPIGTSKDYPPNTTPDTSSTMTSQTLIPTKETSCQFLRELWLCPKPLVKTLYQLLVPASAIEAEQG